MELIKIFKSRIRFDRNEFSGAFGDMGTSLPLLIAVIAASGISGPKVFVIFGIMQIISGIAYGIPMSVQPLKAVAMIVIAQKLDGNVIFASGLAIGIVMLALALSGTLEKLCRIIPETVVRGIQLALGLQLAMTAVKTYIPSAGVPGYILAITSAIIGFALLGNRKYPPAFLLIGTGIMYYLVSGGWNNLPEAAAKHHHVFAIQSFADIVTGFFVLALPQIPMSIGNSIFATEKIAKDLFPEKNITVRKIGITYGLMNIASSFFGGMPVCHGSGGMAGHHAFGARTGGSVIIAGIFMIAAGTFGGGAVAGLIAGFPQPVLGTILLFEAIALMSLVRKMLPVKENFHVIIFTAVIAVTLPYGYVIGMVLGTLLSGAYGLMQKQYGDSQP